MEESDVILVSNLKQFITLPDSIASVKDIQTTEINLITCKVFEVLSIDTKQLKQISNVQKFRAMTKLTQALNHQLQTSYELNDIMNPTPAFVRKFILALINKLGSTEAEKSKMSKIMPEENASVMYQKKILKNWFSEEYILPQLKEEKRIQYIPHKLRFTLNKDLLKRNLHSELVCIPGNAHTCLRQSYVKEEILRKRKEAEQGINRKQNEQMQRTVHEIVKNNKNQWSQTSKKVKKLKKKMLQKEQKKEQPTEAPKLTVFQQQVEQISEQKKKFNKPEQKQRQVTVQTEASQQTEDPLEKLKNECERKKHQLEERLNDLVNSLNEKKEKIEQDNILKQKMEEQIIQYEERTQQEKQDRVILKKEVEKLKIMQDSLEGESDLGGQVKQLEEEVNFLEKEANKQIGELTGEIAKMKTESKQKIQILKDLKMKLNKIQTEYHEICQQIVEKQERKSKVKVSKSGTSRIYYNKKISQMEARWRETQKQIKKVRESVQNLRESGRKVLISSQRSQTELENMINGGKFRTDAENLQFKEIFMKCKKTFNGTVSSLEEINETKSEIQEYQSKVHNLSGKNYQKSIKKIKDALDELKKQTSSLKTKK